MACEGHPDFELDDLVRRLVTPSHFLYFTVYALKFQDAPAFVSKRLSICPHLCQSPVQSHLMVKMIVRINLKPT